MLTENSWQPRRGGYPPVWPIDRTVFPPIPAIAVSCGSPGVHIRRLCGVTAGVTRAASIDQYACMTAKIYAALTPNSKSRRLLLEHPSSANPTANNRPPKEPEERKHQFAIWYFFCRFSRSDVDPVSLTNPEPMRGHFDRKHGRPRYGVRSDRALDRHCCAGHPG